MSKVVLKELCKPNQIGKYGIPASAEDFDMEKVRYLRISDIDDYGNLLDNDKKSVTSNDIDKYILKEGDLVVARTGNSTGRTYYHENKNGVLAFAGFLIKYGLDKTKVNPKYLKYYTISNEYREWVKNLSVGSTRGNINAQTFAECPINLPNRKQQDLLVKVLSDLDSKIELNNKINAELEAMAKTIYDYWFVQFDFPFDFAQGPDANGKPYKSSGGKMIWNEVLKREIPEGWGVKSTEDIVKDIRTGLNPRDHFKLGEGTNYYITIKNIEYGRIQFDNSCDRISDQTMNRIQKRSNLEKGDILFTSIEPVGKTYLLHEAPLNWNINESVFNFKPNYDVVTSEYLFMLLSSKQFNGLCKNASTGSIHKGIRITPLKSFKVVHPKEELIIEFTRIVSPYLKLIDKNQKENQHLASLRDWLLPMLMNGQVTVGEVALRQAQDDELGMVAESEDIYLKEKIQ